MSEVPLYRLVDSSAMRTGLKVFRGDPYHPFRLNSVALYGSHDLEEIRSPTLTMQILKIGEETHQV